MSPFRVYGLALLHGALIGVRTAVTILVDDVGQVWQRSLDERVERIRRKGTAAAQGVN